MLVVWRPLGLLGLLGVCRLLGLRRVLRLRRWSAVLPEDGREEGEADDQGSGNHTRVYPAGSWTNGKWIGGGVRGI